MGYCYNLVNKLKLCSIEKWCKPLFYIKEDIISRKFDRKKPVAEHIINKAIRFPKMFVLNSRGEKLGVKSRHEVLAMAAELGMDAVVISNNPKQPVVKILDYGKFKYERSKKRKAAKAKQSFTNNREVRLTPMIGLHDLQTKARKAREFLEKGDRVKVSLKFRGRELARKDLGYDKIKEFFGLIEDVAIMQKEPEINAHRFLDMYLTAKKKGAATPKEDSNAKDENEVSSDKEN